MRSRCCLALLTGLVLLLVAGLAWAGEGAISAELDPREIYLGQSLILRVLIPGQSSAVIDLPPLPDWTVVPRGRIHGLRDTGQGGEPVTAYRFELIPRRAGELTVPSLTVETGGTVSHTVALSARVRPRPTPPQQLAGHDIFLDAVLSRTDPYVGETLVYTLRLYRAVSASGISLTPPDFPGFTAKPLPGQRDGEIEAAGRRYAVTETDYALTAVLPGRRTIAATTVLCRGVPGQGKGGASGDVTAEGPVMSVTVRPLPPYAGDAPFTGLLGRMELSSRLVAAGPGREAVYELILSGRGNLEEASPPKITPPPGLSVRLLGAEGGGEADRTGFVGQRVFRYALAADGPGDYTLPAARLAVFDPGTGRYALLEAPARTYRAPAPPPPDPALAPPLRHASGAPSVAPPSWPWRVGLALFPPFLFGLTFVPRRRRPAVAEAGPGQAPSALAEALRGALGRARGREGEALDAAVAALSRLDRILYSGEPVTAQAREAAVREAGQALARLGA